MCFAYISPKNSSYTLKTNCDRIITYHNYIGASIGDYCICNSNFLQNIVSFNVGEFNPILSNHCPMHVKILSQFSERYSQDCLKKRVRKIKWNDTKEITFKSNLLNFDFDKLCEDLDNITKSHENQRSDIMRLL